MLTDYWDLVRDYALPGRIIGVNEQSRKQLCSRYAWTITDPATVDFVAGHAAGRLIDPLAGSGYWAHLLDRAGVDVIATDLAPPNEAVNFYHRDGSVHFPVGWGSATQSVRAHGADRTLLLSWVPFGRPIGTQTLRTYTGNRVILMGWYRCCGDEDMYRILDEQWSLVAWRNPFRFPGIGDSVKVYERKAAE